MPGVANEPLRQAAYELRQRFGRPEWLVSIGVIPHLDTIVLYTKDAYVPDEAKKLMADGYGSFEVVARVLGGIVLL